MVNNPISILLLEEDPQDAEKIRQILAESKEQRFEVSLVSSVDGVLPCLGENHFDLLLLDFPRPNPRFVETLRQVTASAPYLPVIVLNDFSDQEFTCQIFEAGVHEILTKNHPQILFIAGKIQSTFEFQEQRKLIADVEKLARLGSWSWDFPSNDLMWSKELYLIFGLDPKNFKVTVDTFRSFIHPEDRVMTKTIVDQGIREQRPYSHKFRIVLKDGSVKFIQAFTKVRLNRSRESVGLFGIVQDITDQKLMEEKLRTEEELRLQSEIIKHMSEGMALILRSNGIIVYTNDQFDKIFGYLAGELMGKHVYDLYAAVVRTPQETGRLLYDSLSKTGSWIGDLQTVKKDGTVFECFVSVSTFKHPQHGDVYVSVVSDITEKRTMEKELFKAQKLESLGVLAGGIAHDFNNILTGILGNISLARTWVATDDRVFARLTEAELATLRASELARQLLTFSKGGNPVKKIRSIENLLKNSVQFALTGSNVRSSFSIQDDLWPVEIDEGQINQVIQNLVINAKQAMPSGGTIKVEAKNLTIGENGHKEVPLKKGNYLIISIRDQGTGIPQEILSKIFDPYFTTKQKGSGLGLSITYSIIQKHNGYITAESKPEMGTTFFVYLPACSKVIVPQEKMEEKVMSRGRGKVLIIDDEESILDLAGEILKNLGYEVDLARGGTEALIKYRKAKDTNHPFDAVITDLTVPGDIGGVEILRNLREMDPQVKVIVSSGYSNDPVIADFIGFGFSGILIKPYRAFELGETLKRVLKKRGLDD